MTVGDLVNSHDGQWTPVSAVVYTGEPTTVYNFRVADHHTYFVGDDDWGFSVWVHNAQYKNFDIAPYGKFKNARDNVAGHELLQHSWLKAHGLTTSRRLTANPAMGLDKSLHKLVGAQQKQMGLFRGPIAMKAMSAQENITQNAIAMVRAGKIPLERIEKLMSQSIVFAQSHKKISAGTSALQQALSEVRVEWAFLRGML